MDTIQIVGDTTEGCSILYYRVCHLRKSDSRRIDSEDWEAHYSARQSLMAKIDTIPVGFTELKRDGHLDMMFVHAKNWAEAWPRRCHHIWRLVRVS